jgi:prepilin-type N-terminal cleavage/methylation domain-containing protein
MIVRNRASRRGYSLIEMIVVISGLAVLMGLCAVTIQLVMRVSSEAQSRRSNAVALGRLAEQFREDVHGCDDAQPRPPGGLRLTRSPRVVIDYQTRDGRVDRIESVDGQPSRHESFTLGRHSSAVFERRDDGPRRYLALVVDPNARTGRPDPARPMEVLALMGKDRPVPARSKGGQAR